MNKKHRIKRDYNRTAEFYNSRYRAIQFDKYKTILSSPYISIDPRYKILDLGCGTGLLFEFLNRKINLIGIDISREMLKLSKEPERILGDLENLPFKDNSFDLVFSFTVIQNLPGLKVFEEVKNILKHNGLFVFTVLRKKFKEQIIEKLIENNFTLLEKIACGEDIGTICILTRK